MLSVSRTYLEMPVIIHELATAPVPPEQLWELEALNPRSRLYRTRLPPDQLNPDGCAPGGAGSVLAGRPAQGRQCLLLSRLSAGLAEHPPCDSSS